MSKAGVKKKYSPRTPSTPKSQAGVRSGPHQRTPRTMTESQWENKRAGRLLNIIPACRTPPVAGEPDPTMVVSRESPCLGVLSNAWSPLKKLNDEAPQIAIIRSSIVSKAHMGQSNEHPDSEPYAEVIDFEQKDSISLLQNRNCKARISTGHKTSVMRPVTCVRTQEKGRN